MIRESCKQGHYENENVTIEHSISFMYHRAGAITDAHTQGTERKRHTNFQLAQKRKKHRRDNDFKCYANAVSQVLTE